ncbi:hypothetical protein [Loktanella sp. SALINAS62]|uniref:hypothetical protein n=1 Tax=Loktanella sp. SALINAS62 TaxID=2706124 RepID=UPI001B8C096E|nr:hypothetical protein [Loktanella sp. SALINAS62]MBS1303550.1 hypothetical protein [Loktanella sp. SALINAS62]
MSDPNNNPPRSARSTDRTRPIDPDPNRPNPSNVDPANDRNRRSGGGGGGGGSNMAYIIGGVVIVLAIIAFVLFGGADPAGEPVTSAIPDATGEADTVPADDGVLDTTEGVENPAMDDTTFEDTAPADEPVEGQTGN